MEKIKRLMGPRYHEIFFPDMSGKTTYTDSSQRKKDMIGPTRLTGSHFLARSDFFRLKLNPEPNPT